ncbi:hypothetical protein RZS08_46935, partial [Arthrospira platensis SPKY1]|nr:hypothetical protein [Arthrospira platensis SPKY1]
HDEAHVEAGDEEQGDEGEEADRRFAGAAQARPAQEDQDGAGEHAQIGGRDDRGHGVPSCGTSPCIDLSIEALRPAPSPFCRLSA